MPVPARPRIGNPEAQGRNQAVLGEYVRIAHPRNQRARNFFGARVGVVAGDKDDEGVPIEPGKQIGRLQ